ncbi:hypothetical protein B0H11DRAFT_1302440 [Mycena galericulata]|nr:hypothetical protein B0H11DRAFT_1302440 [Mycena galericulata]
MPRDQSSTYNASSSSPQKSDSDANRRATCSTCGATVKRSSDLPRHMLTHAKNKEEFMFQCPFPECAHKTLQRSNLETHIRIQCAWIILIHLPCRLLTGYFISWTELVPMLDPFSAQPLCRMGPDASSRLLTRPLYTAIRSVTRHRTDNEHGWSFWAAGAYCTWVMIQESQAYSCIAHVFRP